MDFLDLKFFSETVSNEGWQNVLVKLEEKKYHLQDIHQYGEIYIPFPSQYGFISDIDDTLLISHSVHLRRRLYELLTKNAHTRKVFEGAVNHFELLASGGQVNGNKSPFFYVSGSEWNLYNFIVEFFRINNLPNGVFLLNQLKGISQF